MLNEYVAAFFNHLLNLFFSVPVASLLCVCLGGAVEQEQHDRSVKRRKQEDAHCSIVSAGSFSDENLNDF